MRAPSLFLGAWIASACFVGSGLSACSSKENDLFSQPSRSGQGGSSGSDTGGSETGGSSGSSNGGTTGGSATGGDGGSNTGGSNTGGDGMGGTTAGGTTGDGGAAAESGSDTGGTATGGVSGAGAGMGGTATGGVSGAGAGMGGAGTGGAGTGGAGMGGAGADGKGGKGGGGMPGDCVDDDGCDANAYCKKATCDAEKGTCRPRGPECRGATAEFEPVCGCDHITYWNTCVIEREGINVAAAGECTGSNRPTCTRDQGGASCPERSHAHCYRPVEVCGDTSPTQGVCWVLPSECPEDEPQTQRYCGGTAGSARCIGLCEVIEAENSFRRDASQCN